VLTLAAGAGGTFSPRRHTISLARFVDQKRKVMPVSSPNICA
jgi:hypothetical protein